MANQSVIVVGVTLIWQKALAAMHIMAKVHNIKVEESVLLFNRLYKRIYDAITALCRNENLPITIMQPSITIIMIMPYINVVWHSQTRAQSARVW